MHAALGLTSGEEVKQDANKESKKESGQEKPQETKHEKPIKKDGPSLYDSLLSAESELEKQVEADVVEKTSAFNKSVEDELEETTKRPLELDITDDFSETSDDYSSVDSDADIGVFDENLAESLVANLHEPVIEEETKSNGIAFSKNAFDIENTEDEWARIVVKLDLVGTLEQIAYSSQFDWLSDSKVSLKVNPKLDLICSDSAKAGVEEAIIHHFGKTLSFEWSFAEADRETPAMIFERLTQEKRQKACETLKAHPFSQQLQNEFNAELQQQSVTFID